MNKYTYARIYQDCLMLNLSLFIHLQLQQLHVLIQRGESIRIWSPIIRINTEVVKSLIIKFSPVLVNHVPGPSL